LAWDGFPDVVIAAGETQVKQHPEYAHAKAGDVNQAAPAAKRLSAAMLGENFLDAVHALQPEGACLVPIHALEGKGFNRIPAAFAELLAEQFHLDVETRIIQANVVNHTGASGWQRMAYPAIFDGELATGKRYLLVDDFVGQGGTLANLRGFILHHGGRVVGAITLTGRGDSAKLALSTATLESLRNKYGQQAEKWWKDTFGYDFSCLTESEGKYLLRVEDADTIRARISAARSEGHN
jgi:hypothetical protein